MPWSEPRAPQPDVSYAPLLYAKQYAVTSITFEDPMKQAWRWTPELGLEQLTAAPSLGVATGAPAGD
jgi:hypothetical protein